MVSGKVLSLTMTTPEMLKLLVLETVRTVVLAAGRWRPTGIENLTVACVRRGMGWAARRRSVFRPWLGASVPLPAVPGFRFARRRWAEVVGWPAVACIGVNPFCSALGRPSGRPGGETSGRTVGLVRSRRLVT